ncbi:DNA invertase Pin-like site-specific DNA recombinase [Loktanella sp. PT4BL]|uniref:recombinase family protein n=1 Tax=Loktanella sp. PT4BL TaxID=2135611 RepID=UPI000D774E07|nr:recombinase family protein [Loktanella sp. PT4BL]PXW70438.1 DNA invertase Pin-like site-specific DNA recombinase [Loktanella sp. PT4BL]
MKYGYARVSSTSQDLSIQTEMLKNAGCDVVRSEKVSGTSMKGRSELETLLEFLRQGDTLVVTRLDRLARSLLDLSVIVEQLQSKGVDLKATEQPVDTSTPAGKAFLQMLGVFSEFETSLRKERQMEGIQKAKDDGKYTGRKPSIPVDQVKQLRSEGLSPSAIAKQLGIARSSVYRLL